MSTGRSNRLHAALWAAQLALAIVFALAGGAKTFLAPGELFARLPDLASMPLPFVRFIGIAELAAAVGLVVPAATRIAPMLTPAAASGLVAVMLLAAAFNVREGRIAKLALVLPLALLAAFVARGRFLQVPIERRDSSRVLRLNLGPDSQS